MSTQSGCAYVFQRGEKRGMRCNKLVSLDGYCQQCRFKTAVQASLRPHSPVLAITAAILADQMPDRIQLNAFDQRDYLDNGSYIQ